MKRFLARVVETVVWCLFGLLIAGAILQCSHANAVPIDASDPCVEKTLVVRKVSPKQTPKSPSPIIAWVTVRSGGPVNKDAPRCVDEYPILEISEPELLEYDPQAAYTPFEFDPAPVLWTPRNDPRMDRIGWFWFTHRSPPPRRRVPPGTTPPSETPENPVNPPAVEVPEPGTIGLLGLGLIALGFALRSRSRERSRILFELGEGSGSVLCVELKRWTGRPVVYWYSKAFQVHKLAIFGLVISWRLGAYVPREVKVPALWSDYGVEVSWGEDTQ